MNIFNIIEVVDLGIEKEKKRRDFYAAVAEKFKDNELHAIFIRLRDWEGTHIKKFSEIRDSLQAQGPAQGYEGELSAYMDVFVEDKLYSKISAEEFSKNINDPLVAVNQGIEFEKEAILFFTGLVPFMETHNKEIVRKLVDEERQHIIYLSNLREKITAGKK